MFVISTACKQFIQRRWPVGWQNRQAARKAPTRCPRQATPCGPWFASLTRSPRVGEPSALSVDAVLLAVPAFGSPCFSPVAVKLTAVVSSVVKCGRVLPKNLAGTAVHAFQKRAHDVRASHCCWGIAENDCAPYKSRWPPARS